MNLIKSKKSFVHQAGNENRAFTLTLVTNLFMSPNKKEATRSLIDNRKYLTSRVSICSNFEIKPGSNGCSYASKTEFDAVSLIFEIEPALATNIKPKEMHILVAMGKYGVHLLYVK